ncbi:uncharacterized protein EURHEDRAFT_376019 [Aspergillus ruber CBS 135680]|uniref:F-box domain protein n=1 Tax=Aspergillus ruber (strain CBS 135680) TaxID=1388766 RepID=A0A017SIE6_ASPRC|nr:uncharacterized protein EURHEDRAFT_376019 [Aspergillus ruber CBS 135680]EYE96728.1 hypothetical protein EURHEDRAFT_376019 [Aspergillus ruber CBS 135680]
MKSFSMEDSDPTLLPKRPIVNRGLKPGPLTIPKDLGAPVKSPVRMIADDERSEIQSSVSPMSRRNPGSLASIAHSRNTSVISPLSVQQQSQQFQHLFAAHLQNRQSAQSTQSGKEKGHSRHESWESDLLDAYSSSDDDSVDRASSCYSRRSSLTSMGSEYPGFGYKSADAFSIGSPVALGVFDDTASVLGEPVKPNEDKTIAVEHGEDQKRAKKTKTAKKPSMVEMNKPLPREPPIQMAPLTVLKNPKPLITPKTTKTPTTPMSRAEGEVQKQCDRKCDEQRYATLRAGKSPRGPTLSQAEEELENALLQYCTKPENAPKNAANAPNTSTTTKQAKKACSTSNLTASRGSLAGPLQISRGDMQMIATRPAPRPPSNILPHTILQQLEEEKKKHQHAKMPFHLAVPGFGRKLHLRSFSSSNMRSEMESAARNRGTSDETQNTDDDNSNDNDKEYIEPVPEPQRPTSICSERELRLQLPRLQTKKMEPVGQWAASATAALAATRTPPTTTSTTPSTVSERTPDSESSVAGGPVKPIDHEYTEEKVFVSSSKMRCSNTYAPPYQLGSLQAPEFIYELDGGMPSPVRVGTTNVSYPSSPPSITMPSFMPDRAVRLIIEQASSLDDLFSLAMLNRQFYRIFKQHELDMIKGAVFKMSAPAWELREMSPPWASEWQVFLDPDAQVPDYTPTLYLQRYAHDIFTLAQLKSLILTRCSSFLRPDTIRGLAGVDSERATEIDDALWRIWTFCRIFGCGKGRENDITGQMDWLNGGSQARNQHTSITFSITEPFGMNNVLFEPPAGFGQGNLGGLSKGQMYDMTELFTCLNVLLQPIHGKCTEARRAGVYNGLDVKVGDDSKEERYLEEWTCYVLTLGLSAVLSLGSICPIKNPTATFEKAKSMGLTKWDLLDDDVTRSSFLKEAVSKSYMTCEAAAGSSCPSVRSCGASATSSSSSLVDDHSFRSRTDSSSSDNSVQDHRVRQAAFAAELRNQRSQPRINVTRTSFSDERPISSYTVVMKGLEQQSRPPLPPMPARFNQPVFYMQSSTRPGSGSGPVLDPVDRAIDMMVRELGFNEKDAKWALKTTDTGEGIDTNAAVALLMRERQNQANNAQSQRPGGKRGLFSSSFSSSSSSKSGQGSLLPSVISEEPGSGWRWA